MLVSKFLDISFRVVFRGGFFLRGLKLILEREREAKLQREKISFRVRKSHFLANREPDCKAKIGEILLVARRTYSSYFGASNQVLKLYFI